MTYLRQDEPKHDFYLDRLQSDEDFRMKFGERTIRIGKKVRERSGIDGPQTTEPGVVKQYDWNTDPEFLQLFTDIYEYVKQLKIRPSSDLPETHAEVFAKYTIRESVVKNLRTERADRYRVQRAHGFITNSKELMTYVAESVYSSGVFTILKFYSQEVCKNF